MAISKINDQLSISSRNNVSTERSSVSKRSLVELEQRSRSTNRGDAVSIKGLVDTANAAISEIGELREKQLSLAEEAEFANDSTKNTLESKINELQDEIERIAGAATYNGQNALAGGTFTVSDSGNNYSKVVGLADASQLQTDYGVSLQGTTGTIRAISNLSDAVYGARIADDNSASGATQSADIISELSKESSSPEATSSISNSKPLSEISSGIVQELVSATQDSRTLSVELIDKNAISSFAKEPPVDELDPSQQKKLIDKII